MDIITESELLERIRDFLARHGTAPTTFGRNATGNGNLIKELEEGKSPSLRTVHRIVKYMAAQERALAASPPPLQLTAPEEEEIDLPFGTAPVTDTGASSPISSPTLEPLAMPAASASCPSSSDPEERDAA